jgi:hypothetical protein
MKPSIPLRVRRLCEELCGVDDVVRQRSTSPARTCTGAADPRVLAMAVGAKAKTPPFARGLR